MAEGIITDFSGRMSYGDYLGLDQVLSAQRPLSGQHDETLFIVIHQVQELWLKLMLHEMDLAVGCLRRDELRPAFKATARISRIQRQLIEAWDVLTTMTPHDYLPSGRRSALPPASSPSNTGCWSSGWAPRTRS